MSKNPKKEDYSAEERSRKVAELLARVKPVPFRNEDGENMEKNKRSPSRSEVGPIGPMSRGQFIRTMGVGAAALGVTAAGLGGVASAVQGGGYPSKNLPQNPDFETIALFEFMTEGLTADDEGYLYTAERGSNYQDPPGMFFNRVFRVSPHDGGIVPVGKIPASAGVTLGLAFNTEGELFVAAGSSIYKLVPDESIPEANLYVTGAIGANGLAFDKSGNLWVSGGPTGNVYKIIDDPDQSNPLGKKAEIQFIIEPYPAPAPLPPVNNVPFGFRITANGLAFDHKGDLFITDTIRGWVWRAEFDAHGNLLSSVKADGKTLDEANIFVKGPDSGEYYPNSTVPVSALVGADGIALDVVGNIWISVNANNAIWVVARNGVCTKISENGNTGPLEFPSSPVLIGKSFYTVNFDQNQGYNSPNNQGELNSTLPPFRGKISRMAVKLPVPGIRLPI